MGTTGELQEHTSEATPVDVPSLRKQTCELLRSHVPLLLLLDLSEPHGPDSALRYTQEGGEASWLPAG